jgi:excinuclease ABC subunit B
MGVYDVVVGINLLREGLDLPEVSLVAILDADKEGFLRSETALTQTIGRAARHMDGKVIMYADRITDSMSGRLIRDQPPPRHPAGVQPPTASSRRASSRDRVKVLAEAKPEYTTDGQPAPRLVDPVQLPPEELQKLVKQVESEMKAAAKALEFERAAALRDQLMELRTIEVERRTAPA